jgi:anaerobic C4-dicarboxylate transporter
LIDADDPATAVPITAAVIFIFAITHTIDAAAISIKAIPIAAQAILIIVSILISQRATQADQKDRFARGCRHLDWSIEGDGQSRLEVEAVESVEHFQVGAVGSALGAVGQG